MKSLRKLLKMSFKISFDIKCVAKNKTIYKATVSYFLIKKDNDDKKSNYFCYKHEIEFRHMHKAIDQRRHNKAHVGIPTLGLPQPPVGGVGVSPPPPEPPDGRLLTLPSGVVEVII